MSYRKDGIHYGVSENARSTNPNGGPLREQTYKQPHGCGYPKKYTAGQPLFSEKNLPHFAHHNSPFSILNSPFFRSAIRRKPRFFARLI